MGKCRSCKHWFQGEKITYSADSKAWSGKPYQYSSSTVLKRDWNDGWGRCDIPEPEYHYIKQHVDIEGEIITKYDFGCEDWLSDEGMDHFMHTFVQHNGRQNLQEHVSELKQQSKVGPDPTRVMWFGGNPQENPNSAGWVIYPEPDLINLNPIIKTSDKPGDDL